MPIPRRPLHFDSLADVLQDVETLHAHGYISTGNWDLAQICQHLADWLQFPLDGFPRQPAPIRGLLWILRHTIGRRQLRQILATGAMPAGGPTMPQTIHAPGEDEPAGVDRLRQAVVRFEAHTSPLHPSPLFGPLDKVQARRLQLIHCAHHLSFLTPRGADDVSKRSEIVCNPSGGSSSG